MKKMLALLLLLALFCQPALAEGKLEIVQVNIQPMEIYDNYYVVWMVAEITNTGEENLMIDEAPFRIWGKNGELLYENFLFLSYPLVLEPGKTAYLCDQANAEDPMALKDMKEYELQIMECEPYSFPGIPLAVTNTEILEKDAFDGGKEYALLLTVSNEQTETAFHPTVYYGLYDDKGMLLYADGTTYYDVGVLPGQSTVFSFYIDSSLYQIWKNAGTMPCTILGGAYLNIE